MGKMRIQAHNAHNDIAHVIIAHRYWPRSKYTHAHGLQHIVRAFFGTHRDSHFWFTRISIWINILFICLFCFAHVADLIFLKTIFVQYHTYVSLTFVNHIAWEREKECEWNMHDLLCVQLLMSIDSGTTWSWYHRYGLHLPCKNRPTYPI